MDGHVAWTGGGLPPSVLLLIYGATRESAVLPRGWLSSKAPNLESQHEGVLVVARDREKVYRAKLARP